ncbi:MAG: ketoacyl-ACP synthase III [Mariniblastus sp.]|nr:ketoacyl-ACP synthase III [Mariniblastus sp.]
MSIATDNKEKSKGSLWNRSLPGIRIVSTGMFAPDNEVRNEDLAELGYDSDWIIQRTGIKSRRHVEADQATSDMATNAARACLENAGVSPDEIDLIIVATMTPDHYTPSAACLTQAKLGCRTAAAFDLNAACSGFVYAMTTAGNILSNGNCQKALVIGSETMSMVVDPRDKKTYPLFGDAAGAVLLEADPKPDDEMAPGFLTYRLASVGEMSDCLLIPAGGSRQPLSQEALDERGQYLRMDGRTVFKWAVRLVPEITREMLGAVNLTLDDVDWFIYHQANKRIIYSVADELGVDLDKVLINLEKYGNTSAASIPITLHEGHSAGRFKRGDLIAIAGFGAGLTWASGILRW